MKNDNKSQRTNRLNELIEHFAQPYKHEQARDTETN